jgi:hypothetical protein
VKFYEGFIGNVAHRLGQLASNRLLLKRSCESSHVRESSKPVCGCEGANSIQVVLVGVLRVDQFASANSTSRSSFSMRTRWSIRLSM